MTYANNIKTQPKNKCLVPARSKFRLQPQYIEWPFPSFPKETVSAWTPESNLKILGFFPPSKQ